MESPILKITVGAFGGKPFFIKKEPTGIAGGSSPAAITAYHTSGAFQRMYGPPLATYFLLPVNGSSKFSVN